MNDKTETENKHSEATDASDDKANQRRRTLKKILVSSGAVAVAKLSSESWKQPVIDSVILPAHAQMTGPATPLSTAA